MERLGDAVRHTVSSAAECVAPAWEPSVEQRELVVRARGGDHDAFASLAGAAVTRLDAAARLILRDRELARDAVQDGLVRDWRDLRSLRDPDRFDAWLRRLVVHACIDQLRRRRARPIEVGLISMTGMLSDPVDGFVDRDALDQALASLDPAHRAVVVLHYYLGLPLPEAARMMGIPLGTAKSRLNRAIGALRRALDAEATVMAEATGGARR
jgi:RNA polymerase sigma-70 factor (ECF subfamily)